MISIGQQRLARYTRAISHRMEGLRIVMDSVLDPGNRAAVIRSCEALGLLHVHVIHAEPRSSSFISKKFKRNIGTGSEKWVNVHTYSEVGACIEDLRREGVKIYCAKPEIAARDTVRNPTYLQNLDFGQKTALVFGNERVGVSRDMSDAADGDFTIPMYGLTESFNVSVAASICVHWGRLAREKALGGLKTDLSESQAADLLQDYLASQKHFERHRRMLKSKQAESSPDEETRRQMWLEANKRLQEMGPGPWKAASYGKVQEQPKTPGEQSS